MSCSSFISIIFWQTSFHEDHLFPLRQNCRYILFYFTIFHDWNRETAYQQSELKAHLCLCVRVNTTAYLSPNATTYVAMPTTGNMIGRSVFHFQNFLPLFNLWHFQVLTGCNAVMRSYIWRDVHVRLHHKVRTHAVALMQKYELVFKHATGGFNLLLKFTLLWQSDLYNWCSMTN